MQYEADLLRMLVMPWLHKGYTAPHIAQPGRYSFVSRHLCKHDLHMLLVCVNQHAERNHVVWLITADSFHLCRQVQSLSVTLQGAAVNLLNLSTSPREVAQMPPTSTLIDIARLGELDVPSVVPALPCPVGSSWHELHFRPYHALQRATPLHRLSRTVLSLVQVVSICQSQLM